MVFAILFVFSATLVRADDGRLQSIDQEYFHRDQGDNLARSIDEIDAALKAGDGAESELLWRRCRSLVRRGEKRAKKNEMLADYEAARLDCEKSVKLKPDFAEAHFWSGVAMGRWSETKGIMKAMFMIKPIRHEMEETLRLQQEHGGAHRVLGEMLWQIPGFAGGDKKQALAEFEAAVKLSPDHSTDYQPLAEAYLHFGRKDDAIRTLNAVAAIKKPADPAEYPGDLADAKKLLAKLSAK